MSPSLHSEWSLNGELFNGRGKWSKPAAAQSRNFCESWRVKFLWNELQHGRNRDDYNWQGDWRGREPIYTYTTASVHAFRPVLPSGEKKVKGPVNRIWSSYREFRPIWPMPAFSTNEAECRFFSVCFLFQTLKDFYE